MTLRTRKKLLRQEVLWIPWVEDKQLPRKGRYAPVPLAEEPDEVWTLYREVDPAKQPALPITAKTRDNALFEDYVHDWNWFKGQFQYATRFMDCGVWVLMNYFEK